MTRAHDFDMAAPVKECNCRVCGCNIIAPAADRQCPGALVEGFTDQRRAPLWDDPNQIPPWWNIDEIEDIAEKPRKRQSPNARQLTAYGLTLSLSEWSRITNIPVHTLYARSRNAWTDHEVVCTQLLQQGAED